MAQGADNDSAAGETRRLFYYNGGFLTQPRLRRILELSGYDLRLGKGRGTPGPEDQIAVWGHSPYAHRGEAMAAQTGAGLLRVEDAFLRSLFPARVQSGPPIGLVLDRQGMHYDPAQPSELEEILSGHPLDDAALLARARGCMARIAEADLSKYNNHAPEQPLPAPGYVLVIDQTRGDAAVTKGRADANSFREMLYWARENHPDTRIVIKTHPETRGGARAGYFSAADEDARTELLEAPVSPGALLRGAIAVYTVSSQMGFEAILAGHRPYVFGMPFYAGWGLSEDHQPPPRRARNLTRAQLFAGAMLLYPTWYDPFDDRLCEAEEAIEALAAETRAWREDRHGWQAIGMRAWKRGSLNRFFGRHKAMRFLPGPASLPGKSQARVMVWGTAEAPAGAGRGADKSADKGTGIWRLEDGFLRSRGLGADLVAPLSLCLDREGIYYDPTRPSDLEALIARRATLRPDQEARALRLIHYLTRNGLTKYNLEGALPPLPALSSLPEGRRILVPGQVEDDASIRLGCDAVSTNLGLLERVRAENPDAVILYKPHPDVEAGLRLGALPTGAAEALADMVLDRVPAGPLLEEVDELWTLTSGMGFEALMRGVKVVTLGRPFYTGWGLTRHLGAPLPRRMARPALEGLVHAALLDYPRYLDPITGLPCPAELVAERIASGRLPAPSAGLRVLAKLQGWAAGHAWIWRQGRRP